MQFLKIVFYFLVLKIRDPYKALVILSGLISFNVIVVIGCYLVFISKLENLQILVLYILITYLLLTFTFYFKFIHKNKLQNIILEFENKIEFYSKYSKKIIFYILISICSIFLLSL